MKLANLLLALVFLVVGVSAQASALCDEEQTFTALSGQKLIDCRVDNERAKARYQGLLDKEEVSFDADSGTVSGFVKKDDYNYCFASALRTSFQCSQTLDAATGKILPLSASVSARRVEALSCAATNGTDACSPTTPCCNSGDVCVADASGIGYCD